MTNPPSLVMHRQWHRERFEIVMRDSKTKLHVDGIVFSEAPVFGLHMVRKPSTGIAVTHLPSGLSVGAPFTSLGTAMEFVHHIVPLLNWDDTALALTPEQTQHLDGIRSALCNP